MISIPSIWHTVHTDTIWTSLFPCYRHMSWLTDRECNPCHGCFPKENISQSTTANIQESLFDENSNEDKLSGADLGGGGEERRRRGRIIRVWEGKGWEEIAVFRDVNMVAHVLFLGLCRNIEDRSWVMEMQCRVWWAIGAERTSI